MKVLRVLTWVEEVNGDEGELTKIVKNPTHNLNPSEVT